MKTKLEFQDGSMRSCPKCNGHAHEQYPTDDNAPVDMECHACDIEWRIIWKHIDYEMKENEKSG